MPRKKMMKACIKCKQRKKKCSGQLPCDYCVKIEQPGGCEYRTRTKSKVVKVTERYISSLKNKIRALEAELAKASEGPDSEGCLEDGATSAEVNPLIEPEFRLTPDLDSPKQESLTIGSVEHCVQASQHSKQFLGMSSCVQYLAKLKQSLVNSCGSSTEHFVATDGGWPPNDLDINRSFVENVATKELPDLRKAKELIEIAHEIIGADYMFLETDYFEDTAQHLICKNPPPLQSEAIIEYTTELLRLVAHLALGSLFDKENAESRSLGLKYHRTTLLLYSELVKTYDCAASTSLILSLLYMAYFSLSLNKATSAFVMTGSAIRTMFTLGLHKRTKTIVENRVFWLCFIYDRLLAVRFGFPLMIDERNINIPLLTEVDDNLTAVSLDIYHFVSQVRLAKITTQIITKIYTRNPYSFLHNCHAVLKQLKNWFESLPAELKFDYNDIKTATTRSTFNLHINYNYSIIIATRPVLLYVFNSILTENRTKEKIYEARQLELISVLLESCVQAAEIQSRILAKLYYDGKLANRSFLDCHYIFSATTVLILTGYCSMLSGESIAFSGDIEGLFDFIQHNLKILQGLSEYNLAAKNFNKQLTELIDMMSSDEVVKALATGRSQNDPTSVDFQQAVASPRPMSRILRKRGNNPPKDFEEIGYVDLSQLVNNMDAEFRSGSTTDLFLDEDFMNYASGSL